MRKTAILVALLIGAAACAKQAAGPEPSAPTAAPAAPGAKAGAPAKSGGGGDLTSRLGSALEEYSQSSGGQERRVALGNFTFQDSEAAGPFSAYLKDEISLAISRNPKLSEVERERLQQILEEQALSLSGIMDPSSTAAVGKIQGVEGLLWGRYYVGKDEVELRLTVTDLGSGKKFPMKVAVSKSAVPSSVSFAPSNFQAYQAQRAAFGSDEARDFPLELWVDRGPGGVYRDGEKMIVGVRTGQDCYLKLVHISVDGQMQVIFPNKFDRNNKIKAGEVHNIGGPGYGFEFEMTEPYGAETIRAFASTYQFDDIEQVLAAADQETFSAVGAADAATIQGFRTRGLKVKAASSQSAGRSQYPPLSSQILRSEAGVTYTILAR
ncbi:MAG: DUF4384 domain-containing protein [Bdellovibrionota bacterium]